MRKTKYLAVWTAALCAAAVTGCRGGSGKTEAAESAVADGVLTVGILNGRDAFADAEDGTFSGMEPDILNAFGASLDVQVEYRQAADTEALFSMLDAGEIDLAAGCLTQAETFTAAHLASRNYAKRGMYLIAQENRYVDSLAGFEEGTAALSWLIPVWQVSQIPDIGELQQTTFSDLASVPDDLAEGVISAAVCTEREAAAILESGAAVHAAELRNGPRLEYVFYLAPGQEELLAQLNASVNLWLDEQAAPQETETAVQTVAAPTESAKGE